jgi:hypothetical protein
MGARKPITEIPEIAGDQLLIGRDQARVLLGGVSYVTVCRWEQDGKLVPIKLSEGICSKVFYERTDIDAFLLRRRKASAEEASRKAAAEEKRKASAEEAPAKPRLKKRRKAPTS